jgi:hypothetical protein
MEWHMPRLDDLREKLTRNSTSRPLSADEDLVTDARFTMSPGEFVENKLRLVMDGPENSHRRARLARKKPK